MSPPVVFGAVADDNTDVSMTTALCLDDVDGDGFEACFVTLLSPLDLAATADEGLECDPERRLTACLGGGAAREDGGRDAMTRTGTPLDVVGLCNTDCGAAGRDEKVMIAGTKPYTKL